MHPLTISSRVSELTAACPEIFQSDNRVFIISDENTHKWCWSAVSQLFPGNVRHIVTGAGELNKNLSACQVIWKHLFNDGADRHSIVLNLGGGTGIGSGWICSSYVYARDPFCEHAYFIAGNGGRRPGRKNRYRYGSLQKHHWYVHFPAAGFSVHRISADVTRYGMEKREFAEMMKHGLIRDPQLWKSIDVLLAGNDKVLSNEFKHEIINLIPAAVKVKLDIVNGDPTEKKERKYLNFGHTVGHALESWSLKHDHEPLTHGQAITAGMICEAWLSEKLQLLPQGKTEVIYSALRKLFPVYKLPKSVQPEIMKIMRHDKKSSSGDIHMALLKDIGNAVLQERIPEEMVLESLHFYNSRA
jgi:3-dehydroquinate synthase